MTTRAVRTENYILIAASAHHHGPIADQCIVYA
jgi:hypothetical protein